MLAVAGASLASVASAKRAHKLSADYKTAPVSVIGEGSNTVEFSDDAKLVGRPFGNQKAQLDEDSQLTFNDPSATRTDFSGTYHVTFKASVYGKGTFRGFYDYSVDSNGNPASPVPGVITGGGGAFKGAKGNFSVLALTIFHPESVQYRGHWKGSIRY